MILNIDKTNNNKNTPSKLGYTLLAVLMFATVTLFSYSLFSNAKDGLEKALLENAWQSALKDNRPSTALAWSDIKPVVNRRTENHDLSVSVLNGVNAEAAVASVLKNKQYDHEALIEKINQTSKIKTAKLAPTQPFTVGDKITVTNAKGQIHHFQVTKFEMMPSEKSLDNGMTKQLLKYKDLDNNLSFVNCSRFDEKTDKSICYILEAIRLIEQPRIPAKKDGQHES